ncbi:hypothetical protein CL654_02870 [bacterium]|nr:hypothetical protein [bacterium]|tara:strand:- start:24162 stop:24944 length:783 start_codon:yes stop_codon:yes gene_type:complete
MKYSYSDVLESRKSSHEAQGKFMADNYVIMSKISKTLSSVPAWIFLNLGIKPNTITLVSIVFVVLSSIFFVFGHVLYAIISYLIFALLDSVDGDMARVLGPSKYGGTLDSFGADFLYALIPSTMGFYLFKEGVAVSVFTPEYILLVGVLVSVTLLLYRIITTKTISFLRSLEKTEEKRADASGSSDAFPSPLFCLVKLYRNDVFRNNFFAEPGLILWPTIFFAVGRPDMVAIYLVLFFVYNLGYLLTTFIKTYRIFRTHG